MVRSHSFCVVQYSPPSIPLAGPPVIGKNRSCALIINQREIEREIKRERESKIER